jgi:hypothetical protein
MGWQSSTREDLAKFGYISQRTIEKKLGSLLYMLVPAGVPVLETFFSQSFLVILAEDYGKKGHIQVSNSKHKLLPNEEPK